MKAPKPRQRDAMAAVFSAYRRFDRRPFEIDKRSREYPAQKLAQELGWLWFVEPGVAAVTRDGAEAVGGYFARACDGD